MKIHTCLQGTEEWLRLRAGIPTSSDFDKILTPGGKPSKSAEGYMYKLLAERLMGHPCTEFMSRWMDRGSQMEGEAVSFYEFQRDIETVKVGFITNDAGTIGCSPDRLVGDDGLLEIKVPSEQVHMGYLLGSGSAYEAYKVQMQGQLWISGRDWNDSLSFHPELPPALLRIERDEAFIRLLAEAVETFSLELERQWLLCIERGWVSAEQREPAKPKLEQLPPLADLVKSALIEINAKAPESLPSSTKEYVTAAQCATLHKRFRESLRPEIQEHAAKLLHDWLGAKLIVDDDGNPTAKRILTTDYKAIGKAAVAAAKEM